jgi:head-tail adaptor
MGDEATGSSRKRVSSGASGRRVTGRIEQDTGTPDAQGGHTPNWTTVPGLGNVPFTFRTWSPYQQFLYQQRYSGCNTRFFMRYRASVNVTTAMRVVTKDHIYMIRGAENWDQDNDTIALYCEELQTTGSVR